MRKVIYCMAVTLALLYPGAVFGQGHVARAERIAKALKAKDAKRKLKESIDGGHYVHQDWTADGQKLSVIINEYASPEEEASMMEIAERTVAAVEVKEQLPGVGDEARYNTTKRGTRTSLTFRKGSVVVTIRATSLRSAKAFAKDIAAQLD